MLLGAVPTRTTFVLALLSSQELEAFQMQVLTQ